MRLKNELEKLKDNLLLIGSMVEKNVSDSIESFLEKDKDLAKKVISSDHKIDMKEVDFEEECLKVMALHQPVATDLRILVVYLKINNDLERVGDLAVNIARKGRYISQNKEKMPLKMEYSHIVNMSKKMFQQSLKALMNMDIKLAKKVISGDQKMNKMKKQFRDIIIGNMESKVKDIHIFLRHHAFIRNLERIADMATNIAEDIIYVVDAKIVRHRVDQDYIEDN